jgi:hypothetical protein
MERREQRRTVGVSASLCTLECRGHVAGPCDVRIVAARLAAFLDQADERIDRLPGLLIARVQVLRRELRHPKTVLQLLRCPLERRDGTDRC